MNHDTPEAIAITDKAARELLEVEKLKAVNAKLLEGLHLIQIGAPFEYPEGYETDNHGDTAFIASEQTHFNLAFIARLAIKEAEAL